MRPETARRPLAEAAGGRHRGSPERSEGTQEAEDAQDAEDARTAGGGDGGDGDVDEGDDDEEAVHDVPATAQVRVLAEDQALGDQLKHAAHTHGHFRSLTVTTRCFRSFPVTPGHFRSLPVTSGCFMSLAVTCSHLRSLPVISVTPTDKLSKSFAINMFEIDCKSLTPNEYI